MARRPARPVPRGESCACGHDCGREAETGSGLSQTCYCRWRDHGFPDVVPPPSPVPVGRAAAVVLPGRLEDYLFIGGPKMRLEHAAARLGVTVRTIERYRARLRTEGVLSA